MHIRACRDHESPPSAPEQVAALQYIVLDLLMVHREGSVAFLVVGASLLAQSPQPPDTPAMVAALGTIRVAACMGLVAAGGLGFGVLLLRSWVSLALRQGVRAFASRRTREWIAAAGGEAFLPAADVLPRTAPVSGWRGQSRYLLALAPLALAFAGAVAVVRSAALPGAERHAPLVGMIVVSWAWAFGPLAAWALVVSPWLRRRQGLHVSARVHLRAWNPVLWARRFVESFLRQR